MSEAQQEFSSFLSDLKAVFIDNPFGWMVVVAVVNRKMPDLASMLLFFWTLYKYGEKK